MDGLATIVLVIHSLIALALVIVVLLQRSEGGALGMGGGGGGFMSARGAGNVLTRTTSVLAAGFFATSITLALLAGRAGPQELDLEEPVAPAATQPGTTGTGETPASLPAGSALPSLPGLPGDAAVTPPAASETVSPETLPEAPPADGSESFTPGSGSGEAPPATGAEPPPAPGSP